MMNKSKTKNKPMKIEDMHMMHIENVLLKDFREDNLDWVSTNYLTKVYIAKSKVNREKLHGMVKKATGVNRLLLDLIRIPEVRFPTLFIKNPGFKQKPVSTKPQLHRYMALDHYRTVAVQYIAENGYISADTLRTVLKARGEEVNGQTLTHVFRDPRFVQAGYRRSQWDGAKGRFINTWKAA